MSLVLNGTDGLSDVDGSAATPAIRGTDANTGIFFPAADTIAFAEGGAEVMRIDSSGNLLVGTTSAPQSGGVGVGIGKAANGGYVESRTSVTTGWGHVAFYNPNGRVGEIFTSGTSTSYVTSSDYRLKESIVPMTSALSKVALLKPCTFKWKSTGEADEGFIAHELQEVCPSAVTGEKDAVDADGNPQYQGIDTSFLVATLTAAIQEQQAIITALTARVSALDTRITSLEGTQNV